MRVLIRGGMCGLGLGLGCVGSMRFRVLGGLFRLLFRLLAFLVRIRGFS